MQKISAHKVLENTFLFTFLISGLLTVLAISGARWILWFGVPEYPWLGNSYFATIAILGVASLGFLITSHKEGRFLLHLGACSGVILALGAAVASLVGTLLGID